MKSEKDCPSCAQRHLLTGKVQAQGSRIEAIEAIEHDVVVDRERANCHFRVRNEAGTFVVEQQFDSWPRQSDFAAD